jgi:hypothetical protein
MLDTKGDDLGKALTEIEVDLRRIFLSLTLVVSSKLRKNPNRDVLLGKSDHPRFDF